MLRFSALGVPVEVKPSFWIVALLIAPFSLTAGFRVELVPYVLAWVLVVAVSVLAHEGGHAVVARRFGADVAVTLYAVGGATSWETRAPLGPWPRTVIAAAGSGVGFVLGGIAQVLGPGAMPVQPSIAEFAVVSFAQVNLAWGILNWIPIRPLDGGHIFLGLLEGVLGARGRRVADVLFPLATLAGAVFAFRQGLVLLGVFALLLLVGEVRRGGGTPPVIPAGGLFGAEPGAKVDSEPSVHDGNEDR